MSTSPARLHLIHPPESDSERQDTAPRPRAARQWSPRKRIDFYMLIAMPVVTVLLLRQCNLEVGIAQAVLNTIWFAPTLDDFKRRR